ncbi:hypothetical protein IAT38_005950 [Cryptococcus sp. DSM 104549]
MSAFEPPPPPPSTITTLSHLPPEIQSRIFDALKTHHPHCLLTTSRSIYLECAPILYSTHITFTVSNADAVFRGALDVPEAFAHTVLSEEEKWTVSDPERFNRPGVWYDSPAARKFHLLGYIEHLTLGEIDAIIALREVGRLFLALGLEHQPDSHLPPRQRAAGRTPFPRLRTFGHATSTFERMNENVSVWLSVFDLPMEKLWPASVSVCHPLPDFVEHDVLEAFFEPLSGKSGAVVLHNVDLTSLEYSETMGSRCIGDKMVFYLQPEGRAQTITPAEGGAQTITHAQAIAVFLSRWFDEESPDAVRNPHKPAQIVFANASCDRATVDELLQPLVCHDRLWNAWKGEYLVYQQGEKPPACEVCGGT